MKQIIITGCIDCPFIKWVYKGKYMAYVCSVNGGKPVISIFGFETWCKLPDKFKFATIINSDRTKKIGHIKIEEIKAGKAKEA